MRIAIVCVAYNREDSLQRLLTSLEQASYPEPVTLIISIDKSNTDAVERMADRYQWPNGEKRAMKHEKNLGLRAHMLSLGKYLEEFDAIIVLEDDVTVATSFYYYAKACVEKYHDDSRIAGISLYSYATNYQTFMPFTPAKSQYDVYLMNCAMSWGQVWMKPQWESFREWYESHSDDFCLPHLPDSINRWPKSSWLKYHIRYCIEENKYFVYPYYSLSTNNADLGANFDKPDTTFQTNMPMSLITEFRLPDVDDIEVRYDGFYQPKFIGKYLGIREEDLCVDLFSGKPDCLYKRYLISNRQLPFATIKSYALQLRPIEMNIINQRSGDELWLYDTTVTAQPPIAPNRYLVYSYFYQHAFFKLRTMVGMKQILKIIKNTFATKVKHLKR